MKALSIICAIVLAFVSGVGASEASQKTSAGIGAVTFLMVSIAFGLLAWSL